MLSLFNYLNALIVAAVSAIGAFLPIALLMYIHYLARKEEYKKRTERVEQSIKAYKALVEINEMAINTAYQSLKVGDYASFLKKLKTDNKIDASQYMELGGYVKDNFNQKSDNLEKINKLLVDKMYLESYNFKTYIATLLDRRFPEKS